MRIQDLSLITFLLSFPLSSFAEGLTTPARVLWPVAEMQKTLESSLKGVNKDYSYNLPSITRSVETQSFSGVISADAGTLTLNETQMKAQWQTPLSLKLDLSTHGTEAILSNFAVSGVYRIRSDRFDADVQISILCPSLEVRSAENFSISGLFHLEDFKFASLEHSALSLFEFDLAQCRGLEGFTDQAQIILKEALQKTNLGQLALSAVNEKYQKLVSQNIAENFFKLEPRLAAFYTVDQSIKGQLRTPELIEITAQISSASANSTPVEIIPSPAFFTAPLSAKQILLPKEFWDQLSTPLLDKYLSRNYSETTLPGFSDLMSSRFLQFFVFKDLLKFSRDQKFQFLVRPQGAVQYRGEEALLLLNIYSYVLHENKYVPYLTVQVPAKVNLATMELTVLPYRYFWSDEFQKIRPVNKKIARSALESTINKMVSKQLLEYKNAAGDRRIKVIDQLVYIQL